MPSKKKKIRNTGPKPGFSPKPKRRKQRFPDERTFAPADTPDPITPGALLKRRKKKNVKGAAKRRKR